MKIKPSINEKENEIITAVNGNDTRLDALSQRVTTLERRIQTLEDEKKKQHLKEMNQY